MLEPGDRVRCPHMLLAAHAIGVLAARLECRGEHRVGTEGRAMRAQRLFGHLEHPDPFDLRGRPGEILLNERARQSDRLKDLRAAVRHVGRDPHLRHDFQQALADRLDVVRHRLGRRRPRDRAGDRGNRVQCQPGVNGFSAIPRQ